MRIACAIACSAVCSVVHAQDSYDLDLEELQLEVGASDAGDSTDAEAETEAEAEADADADAAEAEAEAETEAEADAEADAEAEAEPNRERAPAREDDPTRWRTRARPRVDLAGDFRFRTHRWQRYHLGRDDAPFSNFRRSTEDIEPIGGCGGEMDACSGGPLRYADMRLRLSPSIHVADFASLHTTVDIFDGLTLGDGPRDSVIPWSQEGNDAITLRRVWMQLRLPTVGELRVGRMPAHFGLGLVQHAGNGIDDDAGTDVDRIEARGRVGPITLRAAWDFAGRGETAGIESPFGDVPFDPSRQDDTRQWTIGLEHTDTDSPVQGGAQLIRRQQTLENVEGRWVRRNLGVYTPNVWLRIAQRGFRFELEGAAHIGSVRDVEQERVDIRQGALALELEQSLMDRRLRFGVQTIVASGDVQLQFGETSRIDDVGSTASFFSVHPSYRMDQILWRRLLGSVGGAWVLRPYGSYDILSDEDQRLDLGAGVTYSRAVDAESTPNGNANLGLEIEVGANYRYDFASNARLRLQASYNLLVPLEGLEPAKPGHGLRLLIGLEM